MDGIAFLFGWMLFINETKHLFGWFFVKQSILFKDVILEAFFN